MSTRTIWRPEDIERRDPFVVRLLNVDSAYFGVMDVSIVRGRAFRTALDATDPITPIIINETMERAVWGAAGGVGRDVEFGASGGTTRARVIGVARDARNVSLRSKPAPQLYMLHSQTAASRALLHIRLAPGTQQKLTGAHLAQILGSTAPPSFVSVRSRLAQGVAEVRLLGIVGGIFAVLALAVATMGVYGVAAYETARRRREYGVRLALGASRAQINGLVVRQSLMLGAAGVAIGAGIGTTTLPLLSRWLIGVSPFDAFTFVGAALALVVATAAAALGPARQAARMDPVASMRAD